MNAQTDGKNLWHAQLRWAQVYRERYRERERERIWWSRADYNKYYQQKLDTWPHPLPFCDMGRTRTTSHGLLQVIKYQEVAKDHSVCVGWGDGLEDASLTRLSKSSVHISTNELMLKDLKGTVFHQLPSDTHMAVRAWSSPFISI
jgi:hypothetical protein